MKYFLIFHLLISVISSGFSIRNAPRSPLLPPLALWENRYSLLWQDIRDCDMIPPNTCLLQNQAIRQP